MAEKRMMKFVLLLPAVLLQCADSAPASGGDSTEYAVVFDAGSTGSRVHVFNFDQKLNLLPLGEDYEFFRSTTPGLSSYDTDPQAAALSLKPLLEGAEEVVPKEKRPTTPLRLGATAGLRLLNGNASEQIIEAVRSFFKKESSLNYKPELVTVLKGVEEGAYQWVAINYLLGRLGKDYSRTVGVVDLGGGSVQIAYAISEEAAADAPELIPEGEDPYVSEKLIMSNDYNIYVHSYLNYGLKAARAQSLNISGARGNPCVTNGYKGTYKYSGVVYQVSPPPSGTNFKKCRALTRKMLGLDASCSYKNCSFNGIWSGGGGEGFKDLYISSFFYDTGAGAGFIKANVASAIVRPIDYLIAAQLACKGHVDDMKTIFPNIDDRDVPYLCMDLIYEYTLVVDGFGFPASQNFTVLKEVEYKGSMIEAAWPLGCAIDLLSSSKIETKGSSFLRALSI